jgi:hypothetical protein
MLVGTMASAMKRRYFPIGGSHGLDNSYLNLMALLDIGSAYPIGLVIDKAER